MRVVNRHTAAIDGIAPDHEGDVDETNPMVQQLLATGRHLQPANGAPVAPALVTLPRTELQRLAAEFESMQRDHVAATDRAVEAERQLAALRAGVATPGEGLVTLRRAEHARLVDAIEAERHATDVARAAQAAAERQLAESRAEIERLRAAAPTAPAAPTATEGASAPDATTTIDTKSGKGPKAQAGR